MSRMLRRHEQAKAVVKKILARDERARNNDLWLIIEVWREQGIKIFFPYEHIKTVYTPETITRHRRKFNESGDFLPSDPQTARARGIKEIELRNYYSRW